MTGEAFRIMPQSLQELVLEAGRLYGGKTAAIFHTETERTLLTYSELVSLAHGLSRKLKTSVGKDEHTLGVFCHANIFLPVWIVGVLQMPAAYVPLDPGSPPLHIFRIMEKCNLRFCMIQSSLLQEFQSRFSSLLSIHVCTTWSTYNLSLVKTQRNELISFQASTAAQTVDDSVLQKKEEAKQHPSAAVLTDIHRGEQLAYVLHTSGTTGLPKIVRVPHTCIVPNIIHLRYLFQMTPEDVVFLASPLTFDPSVVEMFVALTSGASLLMVPSALKKMPGKLAHVLFTQNTTTVLQATPTLVRRFGGRVLQEKVLSAGSSLRVLALGGEPCPSLSLLRSWRQEGNKTRIFNLYGTTEVSCWACCYELPNSLLPLDNMVDASVPLGGPLMDTAVEVRDEGGSLVTEGEGQVYLGGQERVCLLDDETTAPKGTMRSTGDWVMVRGSHLYYLGRKDRLVKRHGQRIHLDALQEAAESLPQVEACVMGLHEGSRLVAFIVPTTYRQTVSSSASDDHREQHGSNSTGVPADVLKEVSGGSSVSTQSVEKEVQQRLSQLFPSHGIPDTILLVPALPLTNHGKVDMEKLMSMFERQRHFRGVHIEWGDTEMVRERLQTLWKECLGLPDDAVVTEDAHFMLSGGDSLQALRLFDYITITMGTTSPGLLEVLLDGSFSDVLKNVTNTWRNIIPISAKRKHGDYAIDFPSKRHHRDGTPSAISEKVRAPVFSSVRRPKGFVVVRRAGEVLEWDYSQSGEQNIFGRMMTEFCSSPINKSSDADETGSSVRPNDLSLPKQGDIICINKDTPHVKAEDLNTSQGNGETSRSHATSDAQPLSLQVLWSSDTGRCVDASPVLLVGPNQATVFIGSHSHRLQALDLTSGEVVWERVLGDRLESSAAVLRCGTLVAVGSYDGNVYFLHVDSGETWWVFETGDAVKSSPTVDPQTGLVAVGSHDGHVYTLDPLAKHYVWKYHCGSGAVFSSSCIHSSPRRLYSATLGGQLHCLSPDNGKLLWKFSSDVPFFSSPSCCDSCVCIGSVNRHISAFSHDGRVLWNFCTDGPVFSSPCLGSVPTDHRTGEPGTCESGTYAFRVVVCGSHDCTVYALNSNDGSLLWTFQTTGKVYSSPFIFDGTPWGVRTLVAVASTDGIVWVLDGEQGTLKASLSLPGELFSSPVVWGHNIVVGCRNDYVYCLELTTKKP